MKHFSLNLETISPLAIRSDHAQAGADSAGYISGTALAGSLAAVHRLYFQEGGEQFEQLFLSGQVQYPDLYPATFKNEGMQGAINDPIYALPKTAQSCKRFPGFFPIKDGDDEEESHGVRDTLLDWAVFELGSAAKKKETNQPVDVADLLRPLQTHKQCECGNPMDHFTGYYRRRSVDEKMMKAEVETRLQTHTGINRETGTVQEGILYNRRVFNEHTQFWGMVKLPEHLAGPLQDFIDDVGLSGLVRVGTGRTRGMGKAHLSIAPMEEEQYSFEAFKKNLQKFNDRLQYAALQTFPANRFDLALKPFYFAVTLYSPAILRDSLLRYYGTINEKTLAKLLDMPDDSFQLVYQAASTKRVTGWNELWGTPRMNEFAIDTGSVFLFASDVEMNDTLREALFNLEEKGIGQRKAEGFGRVRISDPFHLEEELR